MFAYNIVRERKEQNKQLLMHIEGLAGKKLFLILLIFLKGIGKSYLITSLKKLLREIARCHVAAFTGKAASNISGVTLNSLLFIPVANPRDRMVRRD